MTQINEYFPKQSPMKYLNPAPVFRLVINRNYCLEISFTMKISDKLIVNLPFLCKKETNRKISRS